MRVDRFLVVLGALCSLFLWCLSGSASGETNWTFSAFVNVNRSTRPLPSSPSCTAPIMTWWSNYTNLSTPWTCCQLEMGPCKPKVHIRQRYKRTRVNFAVQFLRKLPRVFQVARTEQAHPMLSALIRSGVLATAVSPA